MTGVVAVPGATANIESRCAVSPYLRCDNFTVCAAQMFLQATEAGTETLARARGWHLWTGQTMGGQDAAVVLCPRCADSKRRRLPPAPENLDGQLNLFT